MKVHHTGYYVTDMTAAIKTFEQLGYQVASNLVHDEERKVSIQFLVHSSMLSGGGILLNWLSRIRIALCFQNQQKNWGHTLTTFATNAQIFTAR